MPYVIEPAEQICLPVEGSGEQFPVHQVYCVGRNYADHAVEMGSDPDREPPFFFMKPDYAVIAEGQDMTYPSLTRDLHHEVELVVALKSGGQNIPVERASEHVYGYAVGVDMTRRDLQSEAKEMSRPWEAGKAFLHAAPCGALVPISKGGELTDSEITLAVNGQTRQTGNINQMIWKIPEVISRLSELFILQPGDLIFTGTPAGVGPVERGDRVSASIVGLPELVFSIRSE